MDISDETYLLVPIICFGTLMMGFFLKYVVIPKVPQSVYDFITPPHDSHHSHSESTTNAMHRVV